MNISFNFIQNWLIFVKNIAKFLKYSTIFKKSVAFYFPLLYNEITQHTKRKKVVMSSAIYFASNANPIDARIVRRVCENLKLTLLFENDFTNLIHKMVKTNPKFVFLDGNGPEVVYLSKLLVGEMYNKTKLILISDSFVCDNSQISVVPLNNLENFILSLKEYYFEDTEHNMIKVEGKIKRYLLSLGFNASSKGFDYIFECVNLIMENKQYKCLKECYKIIKCNYEISNENNIDRDMRSAISNAYELNKDQWNSSFSNIFDKKPTCKNFICLVAHKLIEDLKI